MRVHPLWIVLLMASGWTSLVYEVVWLRRLGTLLGASAVAAAVTLGAFMAGLAIGSVASEIVLRKLSPGRDPRVAARTYGVLEAGAALWALGFPLSFAAASAVTVAAPGLRYVVAAGLLVPPAASLGATWPVLARTTTPGAATALYAANTTGAVIGTLAATFVLLPAFGVGTTEIIAAAVGLGVAVTAVAWARNARSPQLTRGAPWLPGVEAVAPVLPRWAVAVAVFGAGLAALGLEVVWLRLASVALGSSVQTLGLVLATFLAAVALGAWLGRRWPRDPAQGLARSLGALAILALLGAFAWGQLPFAVAWVYDAWGPEAMLPASGVLAAIAMGGAPVASGMAFSLAVRSCGERIREDASWLYAVNTVGAIFGAVCGGLWVLPWLDVRGAVVAFALVAALCGAAVLRRPWPVLVPVVLAVLVPAWDARLYAVGVHLVVSDFADPSRAEIRRYADTGWELLFYDHGLTAAVAVGRGTTGDRTVWLSVDGKVDASTGADMPTQTLSGRLPLQVSDRPDRVLVVGLASGVTAGEVLADPRVGRLDVLEIEPAVVTASHFFDHVNGRPLDDPRTHLVVDDARGWLQRKDVLYDVIISEPSNPWITGVSNLFTREYWAVVRSRLRPGGVFCQWLQLYGMGPDEFRALVRTLGDVFGDVWLFETIPGSDVLVIAASALPDGLDLAPTLDPAALVRFGGEGWLNTDDHPRVEFNAPRYLHYATGRLNREAIQEAVTAAE